MNKGNGDHDPAEQKNISKKSDRSKGIGEASPSAERSDISRM